jgi:hypothetical protein
MARLLALIAFMAGSMSQTLPSAKAMFYSPYDGPAPAVMKAGGPPPRLAPINWSGTPTGWQHVGLQYWFEDDNGKPVSENRINEVPGQLTLHIRGNVAAFLTVWDDNSQLTPQAGRYSGYELQAGGEYVVPEKLTLKSGDTPRRLILVFGRSQTEQAMSPAHARERLQELSIRKARDGQIQVIRETDDATPGQVGTYVVSREGSPLATEIVLRARSLH